jgi:hypothetical protein
VWQRGSWFMLLLLVCLLGVFGDGHAADGES